ncbi:uncharacterized protein B0I36DRAFT_131722 [Microdochium trichocladiopsis]|uniref:Uncharacterized protein n=1 Tax=Microdochium trichocladiopsis TaxID=1682393 RepID=A0A9P9BPR2_9PEZI|nr:uncharacterized protein B0I36DRAFT_131722 [Microdochium trichocladiopsis]KAH7029365.1 hypothetical protein B0I36DRAFT_131722 [Microdochium trichocladiopsis]
MGVNVTASEQVAINLFTSQSPIGVGVPGLSVGVYFAIDLILSFTADMDLSGGFWVDFPEHAYLELGIFDGKLDDTSFDGTRTGLVPVVVHTAYGKFQADLRLSIQAGIETDNDLFGIGAGALLGIYANVVELVATLEKTPTCALELEAEYNLNIGAFARLSVSLTPLSTAQLDTGRPQCLG